MAQAAVERIGEVSEVRVAEVNETIRSETYVGGLTIVVSERQHLTQAKEVVFCEVCVTTIRDDGSRTTQCQQVPCPEKEKPKAPKEEVLI